MKNKKARPAKPVAQPGAPMPRWGWMAAGLIGAIAAFEVYGPALHGAFVLDDRNLPFFTPGWEQLPLSSWVRGLRPLLMLSYWMNLQAGGVDPNGYHLLNVIIHLANAFLVTLIALRLLKPLYDPNSAAPPLVAVFAGGLFLLHPLQTESVAYIAGRSESLSAMFSLAAWALFLYRRTAAISWPAALGVIVLFGAAVLTKEHSLALVAVLLITDYFWNPGFTLEGAKRNWRLYAMFAAGGVAGAVFVWRVLRSADTAGFGMKDLTWYEYFFTQARAIWTYVRLFVLPAGLNADPDFRISRSIFEPAVMIGFAALAAMTICAWIYRKRYPLACYGWFIFLVFLAPTSSIVPIRDPFAERRAYLPLFGLILIVLEILRHLPLRRSWAALPVLAIVVCGFLTYQRASVWSGPLALWQDTVEKSPDKARPRFQLAFAFYEEGRCAEAADHYARTGQLQPVDYRLAVNWALALDCAKRPNEAIEKLRQAAAIENSAHAHALMGMVFGKQGRSEEALQALAEAEKIDPRFEMTYYYRGNVYAASGDRARAAAEYRRALEVNPSNPAARDALARLGL